MKNDVLYQNIKKFRELKPMTREAMAADLGMSVSGYSKLERGEVDLTISKIRKITEILGVSIEQLLNFDVSQIFNVSNNNQVQGLGAHADTMNFFGDDYKEKYIKMLEVEIDFLRNELLKKNK
jgi:transcriptional regulator with XRE-family HTH domain